MKTSQNGKVAGRDSVMRTLANKIHGKRKSPRRRIFSLTGFLPVFPTRKELREEFFSWSDLDPLRISDLSVY